MTMSSTSEEASNTITSLVTVSGLRGENIEGDLCSDQPYEMIELPITVTKGNVKMMWKILCAAPNTIGFVAYRPPSSTSVASEASSNTR